LTFDLITLPWEDYYVIGKIFLCFAIGLWLLAIGSFIKIEKSSINVKLPKAISQWPKAD